MSAENPCDFCGTHVEWTNTDRANDLVLRLHGFGLGVMCSDCDDKQIAVFLRQEEKDRACEEAEEADDG